MIYLFSKDGDSIDEIIDFLIIKKKEYIRIDEEYLRLSADSIVIENNKTFLKFREKHKIYYITEEDTLYFGLGQFNFIFDFTSKLVKEKNIFYENSLEQINAIQEFIEHFFYKHPKQINFQYSKYPINKLNVLYRATKLGIKVPNTYIFENRTAIENVTKKQAVITKTLTSSIKVYLDNYGLISHTQEIKNIEALPSDFLPSLFQELIPNSCEVRVMYVNGCFFSALIYRTDNSDKNIDIRISISEKKYFLIPIQIPNKLERKISKLMNDLNLKIASCDILYSITNNEYYLLEINPNTYYSWISKKCNYQIEQEIANLIIKTDAKKV